MPRLTKYGKERLAHLVSEEKNISEILTELDKEDISITRQSLWRAKKRYLTAGPSKRIGRPLKLTDEVLDIIDKCTNEDDERTALQLQNVLRQGGNQISLRSILRGRKSLGWTFRGAAYCQRIRDVNKVKRMQWANDYITDNFHDVIWSDESTVQLETHKRYCCRKKGQKPKPKPRPKHPLKLHVWGGISWKGPTHVCIFEGCMDAELYVEILDQCLVPFVHRAYPNGHRFMQDNDPKHTSQKAKSFFDEKGVNWWKTPPESPDINPIENLWA